MIDINLQAEYVLEIFGLSVTNTFLTTVIASLLLIFAALLFKVLYKSDVNKNVFVKGWHIVIYELLKLADAITGDRKLSRRLLPLMATLFLFIFTTNLIALLPGFLGSLYVVVGEDYLSLFRSPNSDLTTTTALALIAVFSIQYFSIKTLGFVSYVKRFLNFTGILPFILGLFEALSELLRALSFSFRLFGNVFAGEVLLIVIAFLVPYILPVPFMVLEVFVSVIQAFIFCILTLTFIRLSVQSDLRG
ncbi:MAG: F0F1 ATP synthase subunit A [Candidatus Nomurabacteria bacterium]|nr:F0F1 ATP synthase subunit A [Candidatus Nomurabacteria bacterium]USN87746.1 MAG: F0F1 ATP synthase subunit A [Candidatus Nomurabacteria bacterium]